MTGYTLTVNVPDKATFDAYYYGYGDVVSVDTLPNGTLSYVIDYGLDLYHLRHQDGRFSSGMHFCKTGEYDDSHLPS